MAKSGITTIMFFFVIGVAVALENYMDYGNEAPDSEKAKLKTKVLEFLLSHEQNDYSNFAQQLQPRAAERSAPSLRLRFGRSYPKYPVDASKLNIHGSSNPELEDM